MFSKWFSSFCIWQTKVWANKINKSWACLISLQTHLVPSLNLLGDDGPVLQVSLLEQLEIHLRSQLRGGGQHERHRGQDHHRQRQESKDLDWKIFPNVVKWVRHVKIMSSNTWAPRDVSGYSVKFQRYFLKTPYLLSPKSSSLSRSSYFCWHKFSDSISWKFWMFLFVIIWDITFLKLTCWTFVMPG